MTYTQHLEMISRLTGVSTYRLKRYIETSDIGKKQIKTLLWFRVKPADNDHLRDAETRICQFIIGEIAKACKNESN